MNRRITLAITTIILFILFESFFLFGTTYLNTSLFNTIIGTILAFVYAALFATIVLFESVPHEPEMTDAEIERHGMGYTFFSCPHCGNGVMLDAPYGDDWICHKCGERFR
jgi:ribosomal protein S27AE